MSMHESSDEMCACGFPRYRHAGGLGPCSHSKCQLFRPISGVAKKPEPEGADAGAIGKAWAEYLAALAKAQRAFDRELARILTGIPRASKPEILGEIARMYIGPPDGPTSSIASKSSPVKRSSAEPMTRAMRRVLTVLAQNPGGLERDRIAIFSGYSATSGGFGQALADLRGEGWIEDENARTSITAIGLEALGAFDLLPTGAALFDFWRANVTTAESRILVALRDHRAGLTRSDLARICEYSETSGGFGQALADLRLRRLIFDRDRRIHLAKELR